MIQANELRIGNTITHQNRNGIYLVTVTELLKNGVTVKAGMQLGEWFLRYEEVKGTPLTEEWLLRFGFEILGILVVQNDFIRLLREDGLCYFHTALLKTKVKTVHQLQNLFYSLTGSELVLSSVPEATKPAL